MNKMDAIRTENNTAYKFPSATKSEETSTKRHGWFFRRFVDIGVIEMTSSRKSPTAFYVNYSTIGILITILLFFGGISTWLWNVAYQKGQDDLEKKQILQRLDDAEKEVKKAKDLQLYNNGANEEKLKEKKK